MSHRGPPFVLNLDVVLSQVRPKQTCFKEGELLASCGGVYAYPPSQRQPDLCPI
jgi:hypothetical protein